MRENEVTANDLIMPYFVVETDDESFMKEISSMPGQYQLSLKQLEKKVGEAVENGLKSCILFGIPAEKDEAGSQAYADTGIVQKAIRLLKDRWPKLVVCADTCLCEYTSHGHCGIVKNDYVQNDPTLNLLAKAAVAQARAGADMVAPSDMMDGRVAAIRAALDDAGFINTPIMSYAVKYASAFYGPFREAAESTPQFGDRKTYQMDPPNSREAMREAVPTSKKARTSSWSTGHALSRHPPSGPRQLRHSRGRLSGQRRILDDQSRSPERLDRRNGRGHGIPRRLQACRADLILTYFTEDVLKALKSNMSEHKDIPAVIPADTLTAKADIPAVIPTARRIPAQRPRPSVFSTTARLPSAVSSHGK